MGGMTQRVTRGSVGTPSPAEWCVLIYKIPSEPTRLRATVWRRLKGLGSIYLQNSVAALPSSPGAERSMRKLRHEILEMGGTAVLLSCSVLAGGAEVTSMFESARNDEYQEIIDRCEDFLTGIEKEFTAQHFSFAELEENDVDFQKLMGWLDKVRERDVFAASDRNAAEEALRACATALERYTARVYAEDPEGH
jgi:hypothetical protein